VNQQATLQLLNPSFIQRPAQPVQVSQKPRGLQAQQQGRGLWKGTPSLRSEKVNKTHQSTWVDTRKARLRSRSPRHPDSRGNSRRAGGTLQRSHSPYSSGNHKGKGDGRKDRGRADSPRRHESREGKRARVALETKESGLVHHPVARPGKAKAGTRLTGLNLACPLAATTGTEKRRTVRKRLVPICLIATSLV
jgi:hypothetical protein